MKNLYNKTGLLATALLITGAVVVGTTSCGPKTPVKQDKMLIAGSFWDTIAVVNRTAGDVIEWTYGLPEGAECNSVSILPGTGDVLLSYKKGARVVKRDKTDGTATIVWDYTDVADTAELQTAVQLPDGGYLLAICDGPARIVELDSLGQVRKEVTYDLGIAVPHAQFRRVAKSANGNYLIPVITEGKVLEIAAVSDTSDSTTLVKEYNVGGTPFAVQELTNSNLLVALGDGHGVAEIDRTTGNLVAQIAQNDIPGVELQFVGQVERLKNGNTLISNWQGHLSAEQQTHAQLVEVDSMGGAVWSFNGRNDSGVKFISAFYPFSE